MRLQGICTLKMLIFAAVLSLLPWMAIPTEANDGEGTAESPYLVPRTEADINIDGALDEAVWNDALTLELKYEVYPGDNTPATVRTEVLVLCGTDRVYFGFRCFDPDPLAVRAHLSDRDSSRGDDMVGVVLDTFNDQRRSYRFRSNPLGVQTDLIISEEGYNNQSWDAIWDSTGQITDWGYSVEMAIPYSSLRFQREEGGQVWGFDAIRWYPRSKEVSIGLFPRDRRNNCYLCQAIKIQGFDGASPGRNIEINPTVTAVRTDERSDFPIGDFEKAHQEAEVGITARWGITPNLTFSGTANPDFSQVEADSLQLDINQPFALYYAEKRPFFTEGAEFFETGFNAVHTRTMRDPVWGLKLAGKEGATALGAYVVNDDITNLIFPGSQGSQATSLNVSNTASIFRYGRDIWNNSNIGMLVTDREGSGYFNRVFGVDGNLRLSERQRLSFQFLGSLTSYPQHVAAQFNQPQDDFSDIALNLRYNNSTRDYFVYLDYTDVGGDFRADLGYMPRVDYRLADLGTGYTWWFPTDSYIHRFQIRGYASQMTEQNGDLIYRRLSGALIVEGPMQTLFAAWPGMKRAVYQGIDFDLKSCGFDFGIIPTGSISLSLEAGFGDAIDYSHARAGDEIYFYPNLSIKLGRSMRANLSYGFNRLNVDGGRLFLANYLDTTLIYQFNRRTFVRAIFQFSDIRRNLDLYAFDVDRHSEDFFTQLLFSYKINPRTVLFLGYSDNYFGNQDYGLTQADRTFFVKLGYAWVL